MRIIDQRTGLEVLDPVDCMLLLGRHRLGRLGVVVDGRPMIWPVNYVRHGDLVFFRTDEGSKLAAVAAGAPVAFEIDGEEENYGGWSVVVQGTAEEVIDPEELEAIRQLDVRPWAPGAKGHWVRITPAEVSGRRIVRLGDSRVAFDQ